MSYMIRDLETLLFVNEVAHLHNVTLADGRVVSNAGTLTPEQQLALGIVPVIETIPAHDDRTHMRGAQTDTDETTHVDRVVAIEERDLPNAKALSRSSLGFLYATKLEQGVDVSGVVYDTNGNATPRLNFMAIGLLVDLVVAPSPAVRPFPFTLFDRDTEPQLISNAGEFLEVFRAYHDHETACTNRALELNTGIRDAADIAALEVVLADFENGWPIAP